MTRGKADSADAAVAAADELIDAVRRYTRGDDVNLPSVFGETAAALSAIATPSQLHGLETVVHGAADRYTRSAAYLDAGTVATSLRDAWLPVRYALDAILVAFDRQHDLDQADRQLAEVEQEYADARQRLEAAMAAGDVDAVMDQRRTVTITLPEQVDGARVRALDLHVQRSEVELTQLDARIASYEQDADGAEQGCQDLQQQLTEAVEAWHLARGRHQSAQEVRKQHHADTEAQRQQLRDLATAATADHQQRLRQLAGI